MGQQAQQFLVATWGAVPTDTIGASACEACYAQLTNTDPPAVRTYPHGKPVPIRPGSDGFIDVCGVCRRAMYEDDEPHHIRLHRDDLVDGLWDDYTVEIGEAYRAMCNERNAVEAEYYATTAGYQLQRDTAFVQADNDFKRRLEDIVLGVDVLSPFVIAATEEKARMDHNQRINQIDADFRAATAPAQAVMESKLATAGLAYRRAAIQAWRKLEPLYADCKPSIEPGGYNTCRECVAIYQPRIAERLKRQGLVPAHMETSQVQGDMLM